MEEEKVLKNSKAEEKWEEKSKQESEHFSDLLRKDSESPIRSSAFPLPKRYKLNASTTKTVDNSTMIDKSNFHDITILGTKVNFLCRPYPVQIALMSKVLSALKYKENAILESPTGTGKTLALLCSTLAWQKEFVQELKKQNLLLYRKKDFSIDTSEYSLRHVTSDLVDQNSINVSLQHNLIDEDDDFQQLPQHLLNTLQNPSQSSYMSAKDLSLESPMGVYSALPNTYKKPPSAKKPIIYYGTRTHKQIAQVVKELRENTSYVPKMSILGSREHYCIHPSVKIGDNKEEKCKKLCATTRSMDSIKLRGQIEKLKTFFNNGKLSSKLEKSSNGSFQSDSSKKKQKTAKIGKTHCIYSVDYVPLVDQIDETSFITELRKNDERAETKSYDDKYISSSIWDIEDLKSGGKKTVGCPFFASRALGEKADIVFCPYNYLLNASIRRIMKIKPENNIFILDEAHNIEDTAREAASLEIPAIALNSILNELNIVKYGIYEVDILRLLVVVLIKFMDLKNGYIMQELEMDKEQYVWLPTYFWSFLADHKIEREELSQLTDALSSLRKNKKKLEKRAKTTSPEFILSDLAEQTLESIVEVLKYLASFEDAYKVAVIKNLRNKDEWIVHLGFWCQDSGVLFSYLTSKARTVILASGTMSPLNTFSSELASEFKYTLEGNHVIKKDQVWGGILPRGPSGSELNGVYRTTQTLSYQDDLGDSILKIVEKVPRGALCFFPSYASLNRLISRWKSTEVWSKIEQHKSIFIEPAKGSAKFEEILSNYRLQSKERGAIMMGVFRGKLSEGIDFRDDECRCVLSIGIPFPFLRDMKVELKKAFNDRFSQTRGMLNGSEWYTIQGFRAINQALGRCIRHRSDWGCVVLLESRFTQPTHKNHISRWIRNSMITANNFEEALASLDRFVQKNSPLDNSSPSPLCKEPVFFLVPCTTKDTLDSAETSNTHACEASVSLENKDTTKCFVKTTNSSSGPPLEESFCVDRNQNKSASSGSDEAILECIRSSVLDKTLTYGGDVLSKKQLEDSSLYSISRISDSVTFPATSLQEPDVEIDSFHCGKNNILCSSPENEHDIQINHRELELKTLIEPLLDYSYSLNVSVNSSKVNPQNSENNKSLVISPFPRKPTTIEDSFEKNHPVAPFPHNRSTQNIKEEGVSSLYNVSQSSRSPCPYNRILCEKCQSFLFLASVLPFSSHILSQLEFPRVHFPEYIAIKIRPTKCLVPVSSTDPLFNTYTSIDDGIAYGYLMCKSCQNSSGTSPLAITIVLRFKNSDEDLTNLIWIHPSYQKQIGSLR